MAKSNSAVTQLQDQIESIRQEAYDEGYSAAMQAVLNFAKQPTAEPPKRSATTRKSLAKAPARKKVAAAPAAPQAPSPKAEVGSPTSRRMGRRGENAPLIEAALKSLPNHTGRAGDIRKAIKEQHETELAFTSIRNALGQLQKESKVTLAGDGKTGAWLLPSNRWSAPLPYRSARCRHSAIRALRSPGFFSMPPLALSGASGRRKSRMANSLSARRKVLHAP